MLTTNSILSLDQGNIYPKPKTEDEYYARYMTAADKAEPADQQKTRTNNVLRFAFGALLAKTAR